MKRIAGFDGIRGLAAFIVVMHHTILPGRHLGGIAVYTFFELSGFLIFRLLSNGRAAIEQGRSTFSEELKLFWMNRIVRIFPVYYVGLFVVFGICSVSREYHTSHGLISNMVWYIFYVQDFLIALDTKSWGSYTHTWSLAVENQFYFLFGMIYLLFDRSKYKFIILISSALCLLVTLGMYFLHIDQITIYTLPFEGFLFILAGSACVEFQKRFTSILPVKSIGLEIGLWSLVALIVALALLPADGGTWSVYVPVATQAVTIMLSAVLAVFICFVAYCPNLSLVAVLEWKPFKFLGSISYALYVFHYPVAHFLTKYAENHRHSFLRHSLVLFLVTATLSIALSALSYKFLEQPMSRLKYRRPIASAQLSGVTPAGV